MYQNLRLLKSSWTRRAMAMVGFCILTFAIPNVLSAQSCASSAVTLTIKLDNYPGETSWKLKNSAGTTIYQGGTYGGYASGSTVTKNFNLSAGNYTFKIFDSYGDGICCYQGNGWYTLTSNGSTIANGGSFGSSDIRPFCVGTTGGCDNLTSGGQISGSESTCGPYDPSTITSSSLPSGGSGAIEYIWMMTTDASLPISQWTQVSGATGSTYNPGTISETTTYRRCARRAGCTTWSGESNNITKTVTGPCTTSCDNLTSGGEIGGYQSECGPYDPSAVTNVILPSGGSGTIEYLWLKTTDNTLPVSQWAVISGANGSSYDPGSITETTYYLRCARRSGCTSYTGEANVITKVVNGQCDECPGASTTVNGSAWDVIMNGNVSDYSNIVGAVNNTNALFYDIQDMLRVQLMDQLFAGESFTIRWKYRNYASSWSTPAKLLVLVSNDNVTYTSAGTYETYSKNYINTTITLAQDAKYVKLVNDGTESYPHPDFDVDAVTYNFDRCEPALLGSIGDFVWIDTNGNGLQDDGATGVDGVVVTLLGAGSDGTFGTADDVTYPTMTTSNGGAYDFTDLPEGEYRVDVDENSSALTGFGLTTSNDPMIVSLAAGQDYNDADFGFNNVDGSIAGNVSTDEGVGIPDVTVELFVDADGDGVADSGTPVMTTMTDASGDYEFTDVTPGNYVVVETQPDGYVSVSEGDESTADGLTLVGGAGYVTDPNGSVVKQVQLTSTCELAVVVLNVATTDEGFGLAINGSTIFDPVTMDAGNSFTAGNLSAPWTANSAVGYRVRVELDFTTGEVKFFGTLQSGSTEAVELVPTFTVNPLPTVAAGSTVSATITNINASGPGGGTGTVEVYKYEGTPTGDFDVAPDTDGDDIIPVTVDPFEPDTDNNFVETVLATASIGDFIWSDTNGDGVQDAGELGIDGVVVTLTEAGDDGIFGTADDVVYPTMTTSNGGAYDFTDLPAGNYQVDVDESTAPSGFNLTTGNDPASVMLAAGEDYNDADFGFQNTNGSIGDFVWSDTNGDGVQDAGELGIDGVVITLTEAGADGTFGTADDVVYPTMTTSNGGAYDFTDLPAGNYQVDVDESTAPSGFNLTTGNDPASVVLAAGQDYDDADFGFQNTNGSIGDFVWSDTNGDGVQDAGELGIDGVVITLTEAGADGIFGTADDVVYPTMTTSNGGAYDFTDLPAGNYQVDVDESTAPSGFNLTTGNDPASVMLAAGEDYNDADFGFQNTNGSIGDFVWSDLNGDGVQDAGELGIDGVVITLTEAGADGTFGTADDVVYPTMTTSNGGAYDFTGLPAGTYEVDVDETSAAVSNLNLTTGNDPAAVSLMAGQDYDDADFGFQNLNGSIGDFVWSDLNGDGVQDAGELGIDGVTVTLTEAGADGTFGTADDVVYPTMTTSNGGAYDFTGLPAGTYEVDVDETGAAVSNLNLTTGNDPATVSLMAGQDYDDADFGFQNLNGSIGDFVWNDTNADGIQDVGELGIDGVEVTLTEAGADGLFGTADDVVFPTMTTSNGGAYDFTGLPAGNYRVEVDGTSAPVVDWDLTTSGAFNVTLTPGQDYDDADFGFDPTTDPVDPGVINIEESVSPPFLTQANQVATWTYTVTNPGTVDLSNIVLTGGTECTPNATPDSGDLNNDGILQPTETWIYTCTDSYVWTQQTTLVNPVTVEGTDPSNNVVTDNATASLFLIGANMEIQVSSSEACPGDVITVTLITRFLMPEDGQGQLSHVGFACNIYDGAALQVGGPSHAIWADNDVESELPGAYTPALDDVDDADFGGVYPDWVHEFEYTIPMDQTEPLLIMAYDQSNARGYLNGEWTECGEIIAQDQVVINMCGSGGGARAINTDAPVTTYQSNQEEDKEEEFVIPTHNTVQIPYTTSTNRIEVSEKENVITLFPYPNPVRETLYIDNLDQFIGGNYELVDMAGKVILSGPVAGSTLNLNVEEMIPATYIVRVNKNGQAGLAKFIKL